MRKILDLFTTRQCKICLTYLENKRRKEQIIEYSWFFYIKYNDSLKHSIALTTIRLTNPDCRIIFKKENDQWLQIHCHYPARKYIVGLIKKLGIQTYEADLSLVRRYWIDSNLQVAEPEDFNLLFVDIEVDDTISGLRIGQDQIISFAAISNKGKEYFEATLDEEYLLNKLVRLLSKYDIIIGWNSQKYDIPFIEMRCEKFNIKFPYICHIDMMQRMIHAYRFDTNIKSFSLDNIANHFLGEGKVERTTKTIDMFKNNFELFKQYNKKDVLLLKKLDDQFNIIQMMLKQIYWCNVVPRSVGQGGSGLYTLLDTLILKAAHKRNIKGPTPKYTFDQLTEMKKKHPEDLKKLDYAGALVLEPKPGLYKNVYVFDFKTMYPSIVLSSNIGFDTLNKEGDIKNPSGARFNSKPQSILSEVLINLLTKRKIYKEKKLKLIEDGKKGTPEYGAVEADETVVKELGNSVYGIMGAKWGRYFAHREIVESITLMGQWLLRTMDTFFSNKGYTILTGDTDSIIFSTEQQIDFKKDLKEYHEYLKNRLKKECNIKKSVIELAFDKYFNKFIIVAKKNYAGQLTNQEGRIVNYTFVRGLASVKSDTCGLVSKMTKELLDLLLKTDHNENYYISWLKNKRNNIFTNIKKEQLSIHKKIRRNVHDYKNKPLAVEIAQKFANKEGYLIHNEITYIVTGRDIITKKLTGVAIQDYTKGFDKSYYWDHLVLPNCTRLLKVAFPKIGWDTLTYDLIRQQRICY